MSTDDAYSVPIDRQAVSIRMQSGITLDGEIFLGLFGDNLSMHQKVTMLLEGSSLFFPFRISSSGKTEFLNKKTIRAVEVPLPEDPDNTYFSYRIMHSIPITALFTDTDSISGELMAEVPSDKARLSDCLNLNDIFLCVKVEKKVCYLNKDILQKVVYLDKK